MSKIKPEWGPEQIEMFDINGKVIIENRNTLSEETIDEQWLEMLTNQVKNEIANLEKNSNWVPSASNSSQKIQKARRGVEKTIPHIHPKTFVAWGKTFQYIISPILEDLKNLMLEVKIRKAANWDNKPGQYEIFQIVLNEFSFDRCVNRADGSIYYACPLFLSFRSIDKTGGTGRVTYGARGETSDMRNNITSFNYFRTHVFKLSKDIDLNRILLSEIRDFIVLNYAPPVE